MLHFNEALAHQRLVRDILENSGFFVTLENTNTTQKTILSNIIFSILPNQQLGITNTLSNTVLMRYMTNNNDQQAPPNNWEKAKIISNIIATILIPFIGYLMVNLFSNAIKEKEIQVRYVELAINILAHQGPDKQSEHMRGWATKIINYYSDVKMVDEAIEEFQQEKLRGFSSVKSVAKGNLSVSHLSIFKSGKYRVEIPSDIELMWVFYQRKSIQNPSGCTRPLNADPITPIEVTERMDEFIKYASANKDIALIFTAFSKENGWGSTSEILVNGKTLKIAPYWCNGVENYGYELILD